MTDDEWDALLDFIDAADTCELQQAIQAIVDRCTAAEREACARLADETNQWIGQQIRAREETP